MAEKIAWPEVLKKLEVHDIDGRELAKQLKRFTSQFPNRNGNNLNSKEICRELGLISASDMENSGVGKVFVSVWSLGTATLGNNGPGQIPLTIDISTGVAKVNKYNEDCLTLYSIPVATFDVHTGIISPKSPKELSVRNGYIPVDRTIFIK